MGGRGHATIEVSLPNPRILLVDDDEDFLEGVRDYFSKSGYVVDTARTPEEALRLIREGGPRSYQLIISDLNFGGLSTTEGDQFLLQNRSLFRGASVAVISGRAVLPAERLVRLEKEGIHVLQKSPEGISTLEAMARETKERLASDIAAILAEELTPRVELLTGSHVSMGFMTPAAPSIASEFAELLKGVVIDWLKARSNPDLPALAYGGKVYSANDLAVEVERETEVGLAHVRMLLNEFQNSMGIGKDGESRDSDD